MDNIKPEDSMAKEPEVGGQENDDQFSALFEEAAKQTEGQADGDNESAMEEEAKEEAKGKTEEEPKKDAAEILEARSKRLKEIMDAARSKKAEKTPKKQADEEDDTEDDTDDDTSDKKSADSGKEDRGKRDDQDAILEGITLTDEEQDYIDDMPESLSVMQKVFNKQFGDRERRLLEIVSEQGEEIAEIRTELVVSRLVPDYEQIIFEGDKVNERGERIPNKEFWGWLNKQPESTLKLAFSNNPNDSVSVLRYYKELKSGGSSAVPDNLKKLQGLHGATPTTKRVAQRGSGEPPEDDFESHFEIAAKKARS